MIAAYAQASGRQGLDAAVNGRSAKVDDADFTTLREKSAALNLRRSSRRAGVIDVRVGQGVVRLEVSGTERDAESRSPIVLVMDLADLRGNRATTIQRVLETIEATGRECDDAAIGAGIGLAARMHRTQRARVMVITACVALVLVLAAASWSAIAATDSGK